jgi:hypothetical protein
VVRCRQVLKTFLDVRNSDIIPSSEVPKDHTCVFFLAEYTCEVRFSCIAHP